MPSAARATSTSPMVTICASNYSPCPTATASASIASSIAHPRHRPRRRLSRAADHRGQPHLHRLVGRIRGLSRRRAQGGRSSDERQLPPRFPGHRRTPAILNVHPRAVPPAQIPPSTQTESDVNVEQPGPTPGEPASGDEYRVDRMRRPRQRLATVLRCRPRDTKSPGRHFIPDRSFASIGYGLPGGIGAVLGRQEPRCIATISLVGEFYVLCRYSLAIVERRATAQHEFVAETIRGGCVGRRSPTRRRHAARRRELSGVPVAVVTGQHCGAGPPLHIKKPPDYVPNRTRAGARHPGALRLGC